MTCVPSHISHESLRTPGLELDALLTQTDGRQFTWSLDKRTVIFPFRVLLSRSVLYAMNAPLLPEVLLRPQLADEPSLPFEREGVQSYAWESAFGAMLIEVRDGVAFVNGKRVVSAAEMRDIDSAG